MLRNLLDATTATRTQAHDATKEATFKCIFPVVQHIYQTDWNSYILNHDQKRMNVNILSNFIHYVENFCSAIN